MGQKLTFYPLGNADTCLLELSNNKKILFDYANMHDGTTTDKRIDLEKELSDIKEFEIVMFSHPHEDHSKGAGDFFYLDHAKKYQSDDRKKVKELWVSAAFILDTELEDGSDAKIIRAEARHRLKNRYGIKVFAEPGSLTSWLEEEGLSYDDIKDLVVYAGEIIKSELLGDEIQFFVHAPFSDDCEDVQDKNEPSIVLQVRLYNYLDKFERETNILMTGDTTYTVLDKIVDISKSKGNEEYLKWDIYDIPHHCSYTGLNEKDENETYRITPTENIQWLLSQAMKNAKMVASCDEITEETSPPHLIAKRAYEYYTADDVDFLVTMEHYIDEEDKPSPIIFNIDYLGVTKESIDSQKVYFKKLSPRAG